MQSILPTARCDPGDVRHLGQSARLAHFFQMPSAEDLPVHTGDSATCPVTAIPDGASLPLGDRQGVE